MRTSLVVKKAAGYMAGLYGLSRLLANRVCIFMLHRVVPAEVYQAARFQKSLMISEEGFDNFLAWLSEHFKVVPLSMLLEDVSSLTSSSKPLAVLSFDDGWRDNFHYAYPLLRRRNLPAAIFLTTDWIGRRGGFWWQDLGKSLTCPTLESDVRKELTGYVRRNFPELKNPDEVFRNPDSLIELLKRKYSSKITAICDEFHQMTGMTPVNRSLTWAQCNEMSADLIEFGSHGISHAKLSTLDDEQLDLELRDSKAALLDKGVRFVDAISYPYGDHDARVVAHAAKYYRLGVTINNGTVLFADCDDMTLPRIDISEAVIRSKFWLQYRLFKAAVKRAGH